MKRSRPDEEILASVVPRLVVSRDGAQKGKEPSFRVGPPKFHDAVDSQGPTFRQFRGQLTTMCPTIQSISLGRKEKFRVSTPSLD